MRERLERIETASARKREVAQTVMEEAGIEKITEPHFTVSLRVAPPSVVVTNEADIPEWFWIPQDRSLIASASSTASRQGPLSWGPPFPISRVCLSIRTK